MQLACSQHQTSGWCVAVGSRNGRFTDQRQQTPPALMERQKKGRREGCRCRHATQLVFRSGVCLRVQGAPRRNLHDQPCKQGPPTPSAPPLCPPLKTRAAFPAAALVPRSSVPRSSAQSLRFGTIQKLPAVTKQTRGIPCDEERPLRACMPRHRPTYVTHAHARAPRHLLFFSPPPSVRQASRLVCSLV